MRKTIPLPDDDELDDDGNDHGNDRDVGDNDAMPVTKTMPRNRII